MLAVILVSDLYIYIYLFYTPAQARPARDSSGRTARGLESASWGPAASPAVSRHPPFPWAGTASAAG